MMLKYSKQNLYLMGDLDPLSIDEKTFEKIALFSWL